jgi:hypothetical protein
MIQWGPKFHCDMDECKEKKNQGKTLCLRVARNHWRHQLELMVILMGIFSTCLAGFLD